MSLSVCWACVIVAAGRGAAWGRERPQAAARPWRAVDPAAQRRRVRRASSASSELVVVLPAEHGGAGADACRADCARPCRVVAGGERRQDSVRARASTALSARGRRRARSTTRRGRLSMRALIDRVIAAARDRGAAVPAVPARDTVKRVRPDRGGSSETIPRARSGSRRRRRDSGATVLADGARARRREVGDATDEAMLAERRAIRSPSCAGDERNVKITTPDDLAAARARVGRGAARRHRLRPASARRRPAARAGRRRDPVRPRAGRPLRRRRRVPRARRRDARRRRRRRHRPSLSRTPIRGGRTRRARSARACRRDRRRARAGAVASVDVTVVLERPKLAPHVDEIRDGCARRARRRRRRGQRQGQDQRRRRRRRSRRGDRRARRGRARRRADAR